MAGLGDTLRNIYRGRYGYRSRNNLFLIENNPVAQMEIPVNKEGIFECPTLVLQNVTDIPKDTDIIVAPFLYGGFPPGYSTFDTNIKYMLCSTWDHHLISFSVDDKSYYIVNGGILDRDLKVKALCSWEVDLRDNSSELYPLIKMKPVLRISPECFEKKDTIEKFIAGRLFSQATTAVIPSNGDNYRIKIIIDDIPFKVKKPDVPSVSTTNEELFELAKEPLNVYE